MVGRPRSRPRRAGGLCRGGRALRESGAPRGTGGRGARQWRPNPEELERDLLPVLIVGALGEVDGSHAAVPDLAEEAVGADQRTRGGRVGFNGQVGEQGRGELDRRRLEECRRIGACEQRRYFDTEGLVTGARMLDVGGALFGCQVERPIENLEDLPPPCGGSCTRGVLP